MKKSFLVFILSAALLSQPPFVAGLEVSDHYASLDLHKDATAAEIRKAYRRLSLKYHTDKQKKNPYAKEKFQALSDAYETLGDPDKRVIYDEYGGQEFTSQWEFQMAQQRGSINPKSGFYKASDIVKTVSNQQDLNKILQSGMPALVEFYAPWCVHCQQMVSAYKKAAVLLEEIAIVAAVNCDASDQVCGRQRVHQFPTLKFFWPKKQVESVYQGGHSPEEIHEFVVRQLDDRVVKLSTNTFDTRVLESRSMWLIDFSAGNWCGPCTMLKPHLQDVAYTLKAHVKVGIVNCDQDKSLCERMQIQHYPYMKLFPRGEKVHDEVGEVLQFQHMHFPAVGILKLVDQVVKAALQWRPHFDEEVFKEKLMIFYEKHNPEKIDTVDALAKKHEGHEEDLVLRLEKRYRASFDGNQEEL